MRTTALSQRWAGLGTRCVCLLCVAVAVFAQRAKAQNVATPPQGGGVSCASYGLRSCWRSNEEAFFQQWQDVAYRSGDTLTLRLDDGTSRRYVDVPRGDQLRMYAFRGFMRARKVAFVDEAQYLGHEYHLVHTPSGADQALPCWATPSPDEEWLYCGSGTVDEGGSHGELYILQMVGHTANEVWQTNLGPYQPRHATWVSDSRVEFEIVPLGGERRGVASTCKYAIEQTGGQWQFVSCRTG